MFILHGRLLKSDRRHVDRAKISPFTLALRATFFFDEAALGPLGGLPFGFFAYSPLPFHLIEGSERTASTFLSLRLGACAPGTEPLSNRLIVPSRLEHAKRTAIT